MLASGIPAKFPIPFANGAGSSYIRNVPQASQIGVQDGAASLTDGFPPLCFSPIASGGKWPWGEDVNGLLKQITQWNQWQQAGAPVGYDGSFSTSIGGYPKGAIIAAAATTGASWLSTADNNTTNPDAAGAGWLFLPPETWVAAAWTDTGTTNAVAVTMSPAPASLAALTGVPITARFANTNTGASTFNPNGLGATAIHQGGVALTGGEVAANSFGVLKYDGTQFELIGTGAGAVNVGNGVAGKQAVNISQFGASLTGTGYQYIAGGLIIQWGLVSVTGTVPHTYTLPVAFPNAGLAIVISYQGEVPPTSGAVGAQFTTAYSFVATNTASSTNGCHFICVGW